MSDGQIAWVVAKAGYDEYEIVAIFTDRDQAQAVHNELDLTPTGKSRGHYCLDAYPLNPRTADQRGPLVGPAYESSEASGER